MSDLKTLKNLFNESLYRIPDYQRGYAWGEEQIKDFWFDLYNLENNRTHYTGLLTLKPIKKADIKKDANERWLVDIGHQVYHVIDGQQRLTTAIILIQSIIEKVRNCPANIDKEDAEISFCDLKLSDYITMFLSMNKSGEVITTYKFGYVDDNPSYEYFRYRILGEPNEGILDETYYTLNLTNAKKYFLEQLNTISRPDDLSLVEQIFRRLITSFMFNKYEIQPDFDEYLAFETMNNRGKQLSHLELLKNRLIYLSTLYSDGDVDEAEKNELRKLINDAWKEVYHNLGRNKHHPLNDDEFLRAHWIMSFMYSRKKGNDYINFLLNKQFAISNVLKKRPVQVDLETVEEMSEQEQSEDDGSDNEIDSPAVSLELQPKEIKKYVNSLKESGRAWYNTWFPLDNSMLDGEIALWVDKLNRLPIFYCRPLVMSLLLKTSISKEDKISILEDLERYLFIAFRLNRTFSNSGSSEFFTAARLLYHDEWGVANVKKLINDSTKFYFEEGKFKVSNFQQLIADHFNSKRADGFYGWPGLSYFLYEYELCLMKARNVPRIDWSLFIKSEKDKYSIEHIFPQDHSKKYWKDRFKDYSPEKLNVLANSLGNLLPLSMSINSSLQNDSFDDKKVVKKDRGGKIIRNGYENGSYSEIAVSSETEWTPVKIKERGMELLSFLERRWNLDFGGKSRKIKILNLEFIEE